MATACLNQNGNSAGPGCKFHVCAQLGYGTRYNFGYPMYRRYYVQVTKGQSSNFTSNLKVSWTSTTYALNVAGSYASTGWVSLGNKTCGTSVSLASVNCYYTGGSGATYKSTSSAGSWTVPKATHTVAYNANGGSGAPASQTKTYGAVLTLSSTKPTRVGYTFKGWSTSSTATSATYSAGGSYEADQWGGTVTLYAVWSVNSYTLTYNANGGSVSSTSTAFTYGNTITLATPTRTGYTFTRWHTNGVHPLNCGRKYMYTNTFSVHFEAYHSNWSSAASTRIISCTESGGWNIEDYGGAPSFIAYSGGYKYAISSLTWANMSAGWHTFDLIFTGSAITIYIDGTQRGTVACGTIAYNATNSLFLGDEAAETQTGVGSIPFTGSLANFRIANNSTKVSSNNTFQSPAQNFTLVAEWKANTYTVAYDANGGSGTMASVTHTYNTAKNLTTNAFTRAGYNFAGWNTAKDGSGTSYANEASVKNLTTTNGVTVTLYAQWTPWTHTVTYNGNADGVTNLPANQTKTYGSDLTLSSTKPERPGYLFQGWATSANGPVVYQPGGTYSADQNGGTVTLYAVWLVATKITMTLSDITSGYNITNTSAGKAVLSTLNIPFTLGTVTENASLKFYYHPYYIDKNGTKKYFSTDPIGGQTPTAMGNKGTLTLSGDNVKAYILATENYDYITIGVDTYTAEITEDTKGSAGPYNYAVYINNYTPVYVDVLNVYRLTDSSIVAKVEIEFPSCYSGIASTTYPQLYFNSSAITTAPTSASVNGTIGTYIYNLTGLSGAGTFEASFDDGLTAMTSVRKIAASTANQRFSVEEDTVYALEFIEVGKEGI